MKQNSARILWLSLLAAFLLGGLAGCANNKEDANGNAEWSLTPPPGWATSNLELLGLKGRQYFSLIKGDDAFQENITVIKEPLNAPMTTEEYVKANLVTMKDTLTDMEVLDRGNLTIDGAAAEWLDYTHVMMNRTPRCRVYIFTIDNAGYSITCTALPDTFEEYEDDFRQAAQSFLVK